MVEAYLPRARFARDAEAAEKVYNKHLLKNHPHRTVSPDSHGVKNMLFQPQQRTHTTGRPSPAGAPMLANAAIGALQRSGKRLTYT